VSTNNLTRHEARERAELLHVESYAIELDVTQGPETFVASTRVRFSSRKTGASTWIDAITSTVRAVTLNGETLDPLAVSDGHRITLHNLALDNELVILTEAAYTNTGEGLHRFVDPVDNETYLYTQFEVPDSRRVFPVFEQPDLKATFQFTITAPSYWQVVSNQPTPAPAENGNGSSTWAFTPTPRISSYITALVAGPYVVERSELTSRDGRTIPLGVFCRASLSEFLDADYIFEKTRQGFAFFEERFGVAYPFEKYDQLFVPEFNAGAMENAGCVTFTETYVFRSKVTDAVRERRVVTILHELAHMWFGDLVTMRWWNDLWLNESFAEWASTLATAEATEWHEAWTTFAAMEKSWAYRQDQLPSTHPIVADIPDLDSVRVNFDGITYAKGGSVLKQLAAWVGIEQFLAGVSAYFTKHAWGNTELTDLLVELEKTSGRDLTSWSKLWLETAGVNTLRPEIIVNDDGTITSFHIVQTAPAEWPTIRPHRMAIGLYAHDGSRLERIHRVELDVDGVSTNVPELVGVAMPDFVLINDDDLAYAKIRLDAVSLKSAIANLKNIASPLARSLVWGSVWDSTRDAETPARDFVDLVLNNIASESESTTIRTVLGQLLLAANVYSDPATRDQQVTRVADSLWNLVEGAAPGSDAQFQFLRAFTSMATTDAKLAIVADLRTASRTITGIDIDTDLGWELLISLAAGNKITRAEIDHYLSTDDTATGRQSAAHARAALATPADKQAAWDSVFTTDSEPNTIVEKTALGFQRTTDVSLLEPFIDQYTAAIRDVWSNRSYAIAETLIVDFFPGGLAHQRLADSLHAWIKTNADADAPLVRLVRENLAGIERSLQAQECDRKAVRSSEYREAVTD
jgi:aminopeptidase N